MPDTCPWCGNPPCPGTDPESRVYPCHSLCCLDGARRACWGPPVEGAEERRRDVLRAEWFA